jgi:hypothetical protein
MRQTSRIITLIRLFNSSLNVRFRKMAMSAPGRLLPIDKFFSTSAGKPKTANRLKVLTGGNRPEADI